MPASTFLSGFRRNSRLQRARGRQFVFCTIATRDFFPFALVLFASLRRHHPQAKLILLYVRREQEPDHLPIIEGVHVLGAGDLMDASLEMTLRRRYNIAEFCFAQKPRLLRHALEHFGDRAIYLDSDIDVVGPLDEAAIALETAPIVLTPHLDSPLPLDQKWPSDLVVLRAGAYNAGFIGVAKSDEAMRMLEWWDARVARWGFLAPEAAYQADQKWLDLVPSVFRETHLLTDPGSNVGYWNLHARAISVKDSAALANGKPVAFFHWSGFDPARPSVLSKFQNRIHESEHPDLMALARHFADRVNAARPHADAIRWREDAFPKQQVAPPRSTAISGAMPQGAYKATLEVRNIQGRVATGEEAVGRLAVTNDSPELWPVAPTPDGRGGIGVSWHIHDAQRKLLVWDNKRLPLPNDMPPGHTEEIEVGVLAPRKPGRYLVEFDLVHEGIGWFGQYETKTAWVEIEVTGQFDEVAQGSDSAS